MQRIARYWSLLAVCAAACGCADTTGAVDGATIPDAAAGDGATVFVDAAAPDGAVAADARVTADGGGTGDVELVFHVNWSTATGESAEALTDGSRFTSFAPCPAFDVMSVVEGAPLGWTKTANVLRVTHRGPSNCGLVYTRDLLDRGRSFYLRMYFRNDETENVSNHPFNLAMGVDGRPIQTVLWQRSGSADGLTTSFGAAPSTRPAGSTDWHPHQRWFAGDPTAPGPPRYGTVTLEHGTWYRYELFFEYYDAVNPERFRIYPRIYDGATGELLVDHRTYVQSDFGTAGIETLASFYDAGHHFSVANLDFAREFGLGQEGPFGSTDSGEHWYLADVAISYEGWIGDR